MLKYLIRTDEDPTGTHLGMLAQVFDRFRLQERGRCASRGQMSPFEESVYAGQLSGVASENSIRLTRGQQRIRT
jgi:hypothetical protein